MANKLITTHELTGIRVVGGKNGTKRIGKVRRFVFHPKEKRCVGFTVKRPDLLWMFRRRTSSYPSRVTTSWTAALPSATCRGHGPRRVQALGVNWDDCVLWVGLPVMTEDGTSLGMVGNVTFNRITGMVDTFDTDSGATANALLGSALFRPTSSGFRRGMGAALAQVGSRGAKPTKWCWVRCWLTAPRRTWLPRAAWPRRPARSRPSPSTRCTPRWTGRSRWSARPPRKPAKW
ncbi:MAG: hypothetical protein ACLSVD_18480 [Eggerthellaceae bacterium]